MPMFAALASTFLVAALPAAPVAIRLTSDVAECPSPAQVQSALRQVLGDGERSAGGWALSYGRDPAAPEAERGASVLMELVDPAAERLAVRRIPASPGDCTAIASAMAAVVERSLRTLGWTRGEPLPEVARQANPTEPRSVRMPLPRLVLGLGPSIGTSPRLGTNLLLEARVCVAGPVCLRLGGGLLAGSDSQAVGSGKARLTSRTFTAAPLAALALGPVEIAGGPIVLLAIDQGTGEGLAVVGSGVRVVLAVGVGIGVAMPLSRRWRLGLSFDGVRVALRPEYVVSLDGVSTVVLLPSPWEGIASAKLEFVAWP